MATARAPDGGSGVVTGHSGPLRPRRFGVGRDFSAVRAEFALPQDFPAAVLTEAEQVVAEPVLSGSRVDHTALPLVTVDPVGSKDLDQAVLVQHRSGGFRVRYAIADVAAFVRPGEVLDREVRRRGQTLYLPDGAVPLHPTLLSEGAASLLPDQVRPAVLWTIDLDREGAIASWDVHRSWVRSVAQLDYENVQRAIETDTAHPSIALLPDVGRLRRAQAAGRGAIELGVPEQQIVADDADGWRLLLRPRTLLEEWNAEISLLTGMCAAEMMLEAGVGVLRTVPGPDDEAVAALRASAAELGLDWSDDDETAEVLAALDPMRPEAMALHVAATRLLRGAGYTAFDDGAPERPHHAGIGAAYAHVTAPLRRLVDRYGTEVCLAVCAGGDIPEWVHEALPQLPSAMGVSDRTAAQVERACLQQAESWALAGRVGEVFEATVLRAGTGDEPVGEVFVADPPVLARCTGVGASEGRQLSVRLVEADVAHRTVSFQAT